MSIIYLLTLMGVAVGAISGALAAGRKNMDGIGVLILAVVTALGGGSLRDILLGVHPLFWIEDQTYLLLAAGVGLLTMVTSPLWLRLSRSLLVADAVSLALFTAMGAEKALDLNMPGAVVVTMGVITGVAGGIFRDVLTAEVSCLFLKGELYTVAAILSVLIVLLLVYLGLAKGPSLWIGTLFCVVIRLCAVRWGWTVPVFCLQSPRMHKFGEGQ